MERAQDGNISHMPSCISGCKAACATCRPASPDARQHVPHAVLHLQMQGSMCHMPSCISGCKAACATCRPASPDARQHVPHAVQHLQIQGNISLMPSCISGYKPAPAFPIIPGQNPTHAIRTPINHDMRFALLGFSKFSPGELRDFAFGTYQGMKDNSSLYQASCSDGTAPGADRDGFSLPRRSSRWRQSGVRRTQ